MMLEAGEAADTLEGQVLPWVGEAAILRGIGLYGFLCTAQHLSHGALSVRFCERRAKFG